MTYVVAFFPDSTMNVAAVGPFRSLERAYAARDRLSLALDSHDTDEHPGRVPNIVELITEGEAVERYELDLDSDGSGS